MMRINILGLFLGLMVVSAASVRAEETPVSSVNKIVLVDNFETGTALNSLGGTNQGDEEFPGGCIPSKISDPAIVFGSLGTSLKLDYNVAVPNSFSYYWTKVGAPDLVPGSSTPLDLKPYRYLSFWIKSMEVAPRFGVELHQDADDDHFFILGKDLVSKIPATRFVLGENVDQWRKVVLSFDSFRQIRDWSRILEVVFVFEHKNRSKKGALFVDDILFGSSEPFPEEISQPIEKKDVFGHLKVNSRGQKRDALSLQPANQFELFLKSIPPSLERVHFDISLDGGQTWTTVENFYDHASGESYRWEWAPAPELLKGDLLVRAGVSNIAGQTTVVAGPYKVKG